MFGNLIILCSLTFIHKVICYDILAIISLPLKSHYMALQPLFQELALRGHNVTVINNFPDEAPVRNLHYIDLKSSSAANFFPTLEHFEEFDSNYMHLYNFYRHLNGTPQFEDCEKLFNNDEVMNRLAKLRYDVIFVEQFMSDCALAIAAALNEAPIIGIASHTMLPWSYARLGLNFDHSSDAFYFTNSGPNPSLYHKVEALIMDIIFNSVGKWYIQRKIEESFRRHLPKYELDVERIGRERMKMMFSYQHFSFTGARLLAPQLLEIGGLHVGKPKPLAEDIETFLNRAENGVVYISFGSNLKAETMSIKKKQKFFAALRNIRPLKVLLKWGANETIDDENILAQSWFPQLDVLCHPKVIGFIGHGGMLGISEAVNCGVPMVTVPFFGDQFSNSAAVRAVGFGTTVHLDKLTAESLAAAITEITGEATQKRAAEISRLWHDRPLSVMDSAIYWTEYVIRHRSAPPSLPSKNRLWYEALLVDVYSVVIVLFLLILTVIYFLCKLLSFILLKLVCKRKVKDD